MIGLDSTILVRSQAEWQNFWAKLTGSDPNSAPKDVDWLSQQLVGVVLGNRPLGTSVMVRKIERTRPGLVTIHYIEQPAPPAVTGNSKANPYDIVRMDKPGADIQFVKDPTPTSIGLQAYSTVYGAPLPGGVWWSTYSSDQVCNINSAQTLVFADPVNFASYWTNLTGQSMVPNDIDWSREMAVAINLGQRSTNGYDIWIDGVTSSQDGGLVVWYAEKQPAAGQHVRNGSFSPYTILLLPRTGGAVSFQKRFFGSGSH